MRVGNLSIISKTERISRDFAQKEAPHPREGNERLNVHRVFLIPTAVLTGRSNTGKRIMESYSTLLSKMCNVAVKVWLFVGK